jgi:hypothetical protein
MEAAEGCEVAEGWEAGGMVERDGPGWDGRIKERNRKKKIRKIDCHVGPMCQKKSRGSIVGVLVGVRRKK